MVARQTAIRRQDSRPFESGTLSGPRPGAAVRQIRLFRFRQTRLAADERHADCVAEVKGIGFPSPLVGEGLGVRGEAAANRDPSPASLRSPPSPARGEGPGLTPAPFL